MSALNPILQKHQVFHARLQDARLHYEKLAAEVGLAKSRIELEPQVQEVLEELQRREHERAVGAYEELLTLFLRDVLPGDRDVVMDLRTERSLPALDVFLKKGPDLPLEDALHGTGGSVTNILSSGLRFIALIRSNQRPFLILDEPDCWIKPDLAPKFASVIQSVAEQLGVQVLMISHHDEQMFEDILPHRLRLEKNGHQLSASWAPTCEVPQWEDDQEGLRSIELVNFQAHRHTFIPLSPGVTLLNGENDIGKSAIVNALRAVLDGKGNDKQIRHYQKFARVALDFGPDHILLWERMAKGSPKEIYELRAKNSDISQDPLRKSIGANVPEWVSDLGIGLVDELDIQLGNQHEPVFLLGRPPRERAKALAVGGENAHVQEMLTASKEELGQARLVVRNGEKQLETLHRTKQILEQVEHQEPKLQALSEQENTLKQNQERQSLGEQILLRWKKSHHRVEALSLLDTPLPNPPKAPKDFILETQLLKRWHKNKAIQTILSPLHALPPIEVPAMAANNTQILYNRWSKAKQTIDIYQQLESRKLAEIPNAPKNIQLSYHLLSRWKRATLKKNILSSVSEYSIVVPNPTQSVKMGALLSKWKSAQYKKGVLSAVETPFPISPVAQDLRLASSILMRWKKSQKTQAVLSVLGEQSLPKKIEPTNLLPLEHILQRWKKNQSLLQATTQYLDQSKADLQQLQNTLSSLACPTCGQTLPQHHH